MNVHVLKINFNFGGNDHIIYPVIFRNQTEVILVDCGYPDFLPMIERAANLHDISLNQLTGIIITHHDIDHVGGLYEIRKKYPHVKVYCSGPEEPFISGHKKSLRLEQAEALFPSVPDDQKEGAYYFQEMLQSVQPVKVDGLLSDGEEPDFLKGVRIIYTPGHMPGHISFYLEESKTLVASDAVVYEDGELEIANPDYTLDLNAAIDSVKKLQAFDIKKIICYHGGVVEENPGHLLDNLILKYS